MNALAILRPSTIRQSLLVRRSGLFDEAFYLKSLRVPGSPIGIGTAWPWPSAHYLLVGAFAGADPHPLFDSSFYLEHYPDVVQGRLNPLVHYLLYGGFEGRDPHPLFQSAFYLGRNPDVRAAKINPLVHFVLHGASEGRDPNRWFDTSRYLEADAELRASGENALVHFLRVGAAEGRRAGPLFDTAYYRQMNPAVARAGINPLAHYILSGSAEGRRASAAPPFPAGEDVETSLKAYEMLTAQAKEAEAERIGDLAVLPPPIISLSEQEDFPARTRDVELRAEQAPEVSIIIPIIDGARLTLECLLSISRFSHDVPIEVIIVDNGSQDGSKELFTSIPNIVYIRHEENTGFSGACNDGARVARGRFLVFFNNDAQAQAGWLSALLRTYSEFDHVGAVGPKVLFPDGRLQDAGSAIESDCTSSLIGVLDDPDLARFNRSREVDYVSGVCLMIESQRFGEHGGFDTDFAPAYCEDVDLCLRLRRAGLRVVYQPSAVIVHHLSATSTSLGESFKFSAVTRNQQKLSLRHQADVDSLNRMRVIAFYLPQFHPIPENDVGRGNGFTEWRNVTCASPNFAGHYQPRVPGDLGCYDLRRQETYAEQVALAERYGVHGFCFYYCGFGRKRLVERPVERLLQDRNSTFPFCLCWADEHWTRGRHGYEHELVIEQSHKEDDDLAVVEDLIRYLQHPSYIRIDGRPLLLIYGASRLPNVERTVEAWRQQCRRGGVGEVYLAMVESFEFSGSGHVPEVWGFDAAVECPPHQIELPPVEHGRLLNPRFQGTVFDYNQAALHYMKKTLPAYRRFRTVMPGWDNTTRRPAEAVVFNGGTPGAYQAWLECVLRQTREQNFGDERIVFVNAWNDWEEGAYLEPDLRWGHAYLEATRDALDNVRLALRPA